MSEFRIDNLDHILHRFSFRGTEADAEIVRRMASVWRVEQLTRSLFCAYVRAGRDLNRVAQIAAGLVAQAKEVA